MDKKSIKNNSRHNWWHVWWASAFCALLVFSVFFLSIYQSGDVLQGYLTKTTTTGANPLALYYEHIHVVDPSGDMLTIDFYVDNIGSRTITGFSLHFDNFPSYLNYASYNMGTNNANWSKITPDMNAEFTNNPQPVVSFYNLNSSLVDGHILSLNFSIAAGQAVLPSTVGISGEFSNIQDNYETAKGNFLITPLSKYSLEHPDLLEPTATIDIPFSLKVGAGATDEILGMKLDIENIPSFMQFDGITTAGYATAGWTTTYGLIEDSTVLRVAVMNLSSEPGLTQNGVDIFELNFSIPQSASIQIPDQPIIVNVEFADGTPPMYYAVPTLMYVGGGELPEYLGDICRLNASGNIVQEPNGLVSIPDLTCFVTEWGETGANLIADFFKLDNLQTVNIKDLTILMSKWSRDPEISSISPQSGPVGTQITINGSNFYHNLPTGTVKVYLKNASNTTYELTINQNNATSILATIPSSVPSGAYNVTIAVDDEIYGTATGFTVN